MYRVPAVMEEYVIDIGSKVRLKSGGPEMMINGFIPHDHNQARCVWFVGTETKCDFFNIKCLELV